MVFINFLHMQKLLLLPTNKKKDMMATIVCCMCVVCTAALATYGMSTTPSLEGSSSSSQGGACVPFFLAFTSSCILVGAAYYVTVRLSIAAMESLMFNDRKGMLWTAILDDDEDGNICYEMDEEDDAPRQKKRKKRKETALDRGQQGAAAESDGRAETEKGDETCISPWSFSSESCSDHEELASAAGAAAAPASSSSAKAKEDDAVEEILEEHGCAFPLPSAAAAAASAKPSPERRSSSSSSASDVEVVVLDSNSSSSGFDQPPNKRRRSERFTFLKVWTNVYGLALGMFCVVYSLLLPNELSSFTFCICLWLAGAFECMHLCRSSSKKRGRRGGAGCCCCCCPYWWSQQQQQQHTISRQRMIAREISAMMTTTSSGQPKKKGTRGTPKNASAAGVHAGLCTLLLLGIACKMAGGIVSGSLLVSNMMGGGGGAGAASAIASVLIPVVGVAAIRNMRKTEDIRNTMELSMPVCSMGSLLCLLCIFFLVGGTPEGQQQQLHHSGACMMDFFWESAGTEQRYMLPCPFSLHTFSECMDAAVPPPSYVHAAASAWSKYFSNACCKPNDAAVLHTGTSTPSQPSRRRRTRPPTSQGPLPMPSAATTTQCKSGRCATSQC